MVKVRSKGGQPSNNNARRHGAYLVRYDRRTRLGRAQGQVEAALTTALGGDPSPMETLLLQRTAVKAVRCAVVEAELLGKKEAPPSLQENYLKWSRELRLDLQVLGLQRRAKPVEDLQKYIQKKYGEQNK